MINKNIGPIIDGSEGFILSNLLSDNSILSLPEKGFAIYVCDDNRQIERVEKEISFFLSGRKIISLPEKIVPIYDDGGDDFDISSKRIRSLIEIQKGMACNDIKEQTIILCTMRSLLEKIAEIKSYKNKHFTVSTNKELEVDEFTQRISSFGYSRVATVRQAGEFSIRGGIIDICTGGECGFRIDLFGDEVESIRKFDLVGQISEKDNLINNIDISPVLEENVNVRNIKGAQSLLELIRESHKESYIIMARDRSVAGLDLFYENANENYKLHKSLMEESDKHQYAIVEPEDLFTKVTNDDFNIVLQSFMQVDDKQLKDSSATFIKDFKPLASVHNRLEMFKSGPLHRAKKEKKQIIVCSTSLGDMEVVSRILKDGGVNNVICFDNESTTNWENIKSTPINFVKVINLSLKESFESDNFIFIKSELITGVANHAKVKSKKNNAKNLIKEMSAMQSGDLVVHAQHGIGKYNEIRTVVVDNISHDFIMLEYFGGDRLFVPVENLELLSRFGDIDEDISLIKLDKLGSASWSMRKAKARKKIKEIAGNLLSTAAQRIMIDAPVFTAESGVFDEFCASFPYIETDDQLSAIEDCLSDLQSAHPMDRLICGDVGFGKTEVAMRIAFVVASMGKQVIMISPTTLLCDQHYKSFQKRFEPFGFKVEQLSRMVKKKKADEIKNNLDAIDILVCTHAAFAKSIAFNKLGLVIIDEEQKFGVEQKEYLKDRYPSAHVLSLSATPIPRTLQMSISGVKPMSIIATPPVERKPINTFVTSFDSINIREALLREKRRGGQSFVVCPRVMNIAGVKIRLDKIANDLNVAVLHGKMRPTEIEKTMMDFYAKKHDVLLATNIIESGIDIRNVNTIIVYNADMFGLSQLYQIRGRVGRSALSSYAYLCPSNTLINENAKKRLEIMQSLDKLGGSFTLASFDLDMRGAGNLLGQSQSGHVKEIGVELYQHMLLEEIEKLKRESEHSNNAIAVDDEWSPNINLGINVMIPGDYVVDSDVRLSLYQRAATLDSDEEISAFMIELCDRFGNIPDEVMNLMEIIKLKSLCKMANVVSLTLGANGLTLEFYKQTFAKPDSLLRYVHENTGIVSILPGQKLLFKRRVNGEQVKIKFVKDVLSDIIAIL